MLVGPDQGLNGRCRCNGVLVLAGVGEGVTDRGLRALANAGCGRVLTSLTLEGEFSPGFCACCFCFHGWSGFDLSGVCVDGMVRLLGGTKD